MNDALLMMRLFARLHWDNISGFFSDEALEQAVCERWQNELNQPDQSAEIQFDFLHVATQLYEQGGHSRLLRQLFAGLSSHGTQGLILTDRKAKNDLADLPIAPICLSGSLASRVNKLLEQGAKARTILLHIHPDDSVAAFAARILRKAGKHVLFVNHADHVFSLGPGTADIVLEICATGWRTTSERRAALAQSFMGIPIASSENAKAIWKKDRTGPIVSMGGPGKFKPSEVLSFPHFAERILSRVDNDIVLIGPSDKDPWWAEVASKFPSRLKLLGTQAPKAVAEIMRNAACYVDSFPLDGGTAYPQTALMGLPCFGPNANNASGVSAAEQLRFATLAQMEDAIVSFLHTGAYPFDLEAVRKSIRTDLSVEAVTARVVRATQGGTCPLPPALKRIGSRGPDYNALRWEEDGILHLPKRQWRGLSPGARLRLLRLIGQANLPSTLEKTIKFRICTKWF
jgi:hypothetical protein